jgi:hypothetical protein
VRGRGALRALRRARGRALRCRRRLPLRLLRRKGARRQLRRVAPPPHALRRRGRRPGGVRLRDELLRVHGRPGAAGTGAWAPARGGGPRGVGQADGDPGGGGAPARGPGVRPRRRRCRRARPAARRDGGRAVAGGGGGRRRRPRPGRRAPPAGGLRARAGEARRGGGVVSADRRTRQEAARCGPRGGRLGRMLVDRPRIQPNAFLRTLSSSSFLLKLNLVVRSRQSVFVLNCRRFE